MPTIKVLSAVMLFSTGPVCAADLPQMDEPKLVMPVSHGVPPAARRTVNRCNAAIAEWAAQYEPVAVETSPTEPLHRGPGGVRVVTLLVKIDYQRAGGIEPRSATVTCTVAADGQVSVSLL